MIDITTLRAMAAAGASVDVILAAVEAELLAEGERVQARRAKDAERQRQWRSRHSLSQPVTVCHSDALSRAPLTSLLSSSLLPQTKKEERKKERDSTSRKTALPNDWKPNPAHYAKADKFKFPNSFVDEQADAMRNWALSKDIRRHNWDATFHGFIRPKEGQSNGYRGQGTLQAAGGNIIPAQRSLIAKLAELDQPTRTDELRSRESIADVRLLSKR